MKLSTIAKNFLKESAAPVVPDAAKQMLYDPSLGETGFGKALKMVYGNTVPLYHATTPEAARDIDQNGFKLLRGRQMKSWEERDIIYFQIGKSDYVDSDRSVLYRMDAPVEWITQYCEADMDSAYVNDEDFIAATGMEPDEYTTDQRDLITYFLAYDQTFHGMELLVTSNDDPNFKFPSKPVRVTPVRDKSVVKKRTVKEPPEIKLVYTGINKKTGNRMYKKQR